MVENPLAKTEISPGSSASERRKRYAAAMDAITGGICPTDLIDAVMAVADEELRIRQDQQAGGGTELADLREERDQYASAIRHLCQTVRHTAYVWSQTLPETIRTEEVVTALSGLCSHVPVRDHLRDDLWQRIVGAYYARFESEGHPEDSKAAADEAMTVVRPELERRDDELARHREEVARLRRDEASANRGARIALEQRQEMAAERFEWQERAIRAEAELARLKGEAA